MGELPNKKNKVQIGSIIAWILCGILFIFVAYEIVLKFTNNSIYLFGYRSDVILSESMSYKNTEDPVCVDFLKNYNNQYQKGDLVFSTKVTETSELNVGDVVLFNHNESGLLTCHRIVEHYVTLDGKDVYIIRADVAKSSENDGLYLRERIVSRVTGSIPKIGYFINFAQSFYGMILFAGLIVVIIVFDTLISKAKEEEEALENNANYSICDNKLKEENNKNIDKAQDNVNSVKLLNTKCSNTLVININLPKQKYICLKCNKVFVSSHYPDECPNCHCKIKNPYKKEGDKKGL